MPTTTGTGQVLNSSPLVERIHNSQNNQTQYAAQFAGEQQARKLLRQAETVHQSENGEKVSIHKDPGEPHHDRRLAGENPEETPPEQNAASGDIEKPKSPLKHIDIRA